MKPTRTWVLVADGKRARILKQNGTMSDLEAMAGASFENELHKTSDVRTDKAGRVQESVGGAHHAVAARTDWHREEKHQFARTLAKYLDEAAERHDYDRLILVAAPRTLGDLREALGRHAQDRLAGELDKDLTEMTVADVGARLVQAALL